MKELPKKWCIQVTSQNKKMLTAWLNEQPNVDRDYTVKGWVLSDCDYDRSYMYWGGAPSDRTVINDSEFKELVLNQSKPINNSYEIY